MFFMNLTKYQYRSLVVFVNDLVVIIVKWDDQNKEKSSISQRKVMISKWNSEKIKWIQNTLEVWELALFLSFVQSVGVSGSS